MKKKIEKFRAGYTEKYARIKREVPDSVLELFQLKQRVAKEERRSRFALPKVKVAALTHRYNFDDLEGADKDDLKDVKYSIRKTVESIPDPEGFQTKEVTLTLKKQINEAIKWADYAFKQADANDPLIISEYLKKAEDPKEANSAVKQHLLIRENEKKEHERKKEAWKRIFEHVIPENVVMNAHARLNVIAGHMVDGYNSDYPQMMTDPFAVYFKRKIYKSSLERTHYYDWLDAVCGAFFPHNFDESKTILI